MISEKNGKGQKKVSDEKQNKEDWKEYMCEGTGRGQVKGQDKTCLGTEYLEGMID